MASKTAFGTLFGITPAQGQQITTMATPIGSDVGEIVETMGNAVIDLLFVGIRFVVGFADTFGNHFGVTFGVTRVLAICTLHAS